MTLPKIADKKPAVFRFYFGWQPSDIRFSGRDQFGAFMQQECERFGSPLQKRP